ncbi:MAG: hypothetical protein ING75_07595 [Rhodocyclaceae bacterium]|nr:hypothetical protein [Rhodocyclaceae bacterium]
MNIPPVYPFSDIPACAELQAVLNSLYRKTNLNHWHSIREAGIRECRESMIASVRDQLEDKKAGLAEEIDALVPDIRKSTRRLVDPPWVQVASADTEPARKLSRAYVYWSYSNDFLGRGNGVSGSSIDRQFGEPFQCDIEEIQFTYPCIACGQPANTSAAALSMDIDNRVDFKLFCPHCKHEDEFPEYSNARSAGRFQIISATQYCEVYKGMLRWKASRVVTRR